MTQRFGLTPFVCGVLVFLSACSDASRVSPFASSGQVSSPGEAPKVSFYAASRFAEQATFGPTPELIAGIQEKGFEKWIDDQFELPASQITNPFSIKVLENPNDNPDVDRWYRRQFSDMAIGGSDQLRLRLAWSLSQFITVSDRRLSIHATYAWVNLLQRVSTSSYPQILKEISRSPSMGWYLDNTWNRPKSDQCPWCAPNENYARELMQLFSIGVVKLNEQGVPQRDVRGDPIEIYTQRDVEQLASALTGWRDQHYPPSSNPGHDWGFVNFSKQQVPSDWYYDHDWTEKTVLGQKIAANQGPEQDLDRVVEILMGHQNIGPFVAIRMIQHLVKSNPSGAYIKRVADRFKQTNGDIKAVVKAVLLDPEARSGDVIGNISATDGKLREPFLHEMAIWRALECRRTPLNQEGHIAFYGSQRPFNPETVFSFYAPTDMASGTTLLAPEHRLLNSMEFRGRLATLRHLYWGQVIPDGKRQSDLVLASAQCSIESFQAAYSQSPRSLFNMMGERFFRGAMPPPLRSELDRLHRGNTWEHPNDVMLILLDYALTSPYFGAKR